MPDTIEPLLGQADARSAHCSRRVWPFLLLIGLGCTLLWVRWAHGEQSGITEPTIDMAVHIMNPPTSVQSMQPARVGHLVRPGFAQVAKPAPFQRTGVVAHAVATGRTYEVEQPKPTGVQFKEKAGGIFVSKVDRNADPRIKVGDKLLVVSASFGGEKWPAKSYQQSMFALSTRVGLVYMKLESLGKQGGGGGVFGGRAANQPVGQYICLDCGWLYNEFADGKTFQQEPGSFVCPQCQSSKNRFRKKNMETGEIEQGGIDPIQLGIYATVIGGLVGLAVLFYVGLNL